MSERSLCSSNPLWNPFRDGERTRFSITQAIAHQRDAFRERLRAPAQQPGASTQRYLLGFVPRSATDIPAKFDVLFREANRGSRALSSTARAYSWRGTGASH